MAPDWIAAIPSGVQSEERGIEDAVVKGQGLSGGTVLSSGIGFALQHLGTTRATLLMPKAAAVQPIKTSEQTVEDASARPRNTSGTHQTSRNCDGSWLCGPNDFHTIGSQIHPFSKCIVNHCECSLCARLFVQIIGIRNLSNVDHSKHCLSTVLAKKAAQPLSIQQVQQSAPVDQATLGGPDLQVQ